MHGVHDDLGSKVTVETACVHGSDVILLRGCVRVHNIIVTNINNIVHTVMIYSRST